jgi:hypothetical protein
MGAFGVLVLVCLVAAGAATAQVRSVAGATAKPAPAPTSACQLNGPIKHVVYLQFDNTHYMRDILIHNDSAPTFYVAGQPNRADPTLRKLERDVAGLNAIDPYESSAAAPVFQQLADPVEEQTLHMQNTDPNRTPSFTAFANPDYFITASSSGPSCGSNPCIDYHFAWSHGDIQPVIATTWMGLVGPGVQSRGIDSTTWTDHTNVRPTMLELLGLKDDYLHDGHVLLEAVDKHALPNTLFAHEKTTAELEAIYEQLNAPFGSFAMDTLTASTKGIVSTDESVYNSYENAIENLTTQRDALAFQIKSALDAAAFDGQQIKEQQAKDWIEQAQSLIDQAHALAGS